MAKPSSNTAFNASDIQDGSTFNPTAFQKAQITGQTFGLPRGVQSIRLQFGELANQGSYLVARFLYQDSVGWAAATSTSSAMPRSTSPRSSACAVSSPGSTSFAG